MKKLFLSSFIFTIIYIIIHIWSNVLAKNYTEQKNEAVKYLHTIKNWNNIIKKIDSIVNKYDNTKLAIILNYLPNLKGRFKWESIYIYNYFEWKIWEKLWKNDEVDIVDNLEEELNNVIHSKQNTTNINVNNPTPEIVPQNQINYLDTETWWKTFNPNNFEIPTWEYKAYYFNTNEPTKVIATEKVKNIWLNYAFNNFNNIKSEDFWAYYLWFIDFKDDETKKIQYSISWSNIRIIIDWKLVVTSKNNGWEVPYYFTKWKHKIEVEYTNNWHTTGFNVTFKSDKQTSYNSTNIKDLITPDTKILYFWVYESGNRDNSIDVDLNYTNWPAIVVLTSYDPILWNLKNVTSNIKAIVYSSYWNWTTVDTDWDTQVINIQWLWFEHSIEPVYSDINWMLHYESYWIRKINETANRFFWKNIYWFNWWYSMTSWTLPNIIITDEKLKDYMKVYDDLEAKHKAKTLSIKELFWDNKTTTWWKYINPTSDIPTWEFKAFYFDSTKASTIVSTENVTEIKKKFSWDFEKINSENFWAYYVWNFNFDQDMVKTIKYGLSWSELRITVDDSIVISTQNSPWVLTYKFTKWKHKIEVEYLNNWHTAEYYVNF